MQVQGFSLIELVASLAIAAVLLLSMQQVFSQALNLKAEASVKNSALLDVEFAMRRMLKHSAESQRLLLPSNDRNATPTNEAVRDQTVGASGTTAVLAVSLPESVDRDGDGFADADNDRDGLIDEDTSRDIHNDSEPGIQGIDDDADGQTDEGFFTDGNDDEYLFIQDEDALDALDNDGDGTVDEDWGGDNNGDGKPGIAGVDDDGDGQIDEGSNSDDDEDGQVDEDWIDPVVYYLAGSALIERMPVPWDVDGNNSLDGRDYLESSVLDNIVQFKVERVVTPEIHYPLVEITLVVEDEAGNQHSLHSRIRVGSSL